MAIRQSLAAAEAKVAQHKSGGFTTEADRKSFTVTYSPASIAQAIADARTKFGNTRVPEYTISSLTAGEKQTIGITGADGSGSQTMRINQMFWDNVYTAGSTYIVHEGASGKFAIADGKIYHFVCGVGNTDDFLEFQNLIERHMAYSYIHSEGTETEADNALSDYNTYLSNLS